MTNDTFTDAELAEAEASRADWIASGLDPNVSVEKLAATIRTLRANALIHDAAQSTSSAGVRTPESPRAAERDRRKVVNEALQRLVDAHNSGLRSAIDAAAQAYVDINNDAWDAYYASIAPAVLPHSPHPATAAILAVMPINRGDGTVFTGWHVERDQRGEDVSFPIYGDPEPLAAQYAAAVLRWLADDLSTDEEIAFGYRKLIDSQGIRRIADRIEGTVR